MHQSYLQSIVLGVKKVTVCNESHMLANKACPETTTYIYKLNSDGEYVLDGYMWDQSLLKEHCNIHLDKKKDKKDHNSENYSDD